MQTQNRAAFVLHSRAYKENQALLEVLVMDEGRMSLITYKGGKKNSAKNALMQPFRPLQIQIKKDSGLRKLVAIDPHPELTAASVALSGKALFCGFYLNEIICRLCPADAFFPELYESYLASLQQLSTLEAESERFEVELQLVLRRFEYRLLLLLGYGLNLETEVEQGQGISNEQFYELYPESGFVVVSPSHRAIAGQTILQLAELLEGQIVGDSSGQIGIEQAKPLLTTAKFILRACLHRHLGDKPLKSRELFRAN